MVAAEPCVAGLFAVELLAAEPLTAALFAAQLLAAYLSAAALSADPRRRAQDPGCPSSPSRDKLLG